MCGLIGMGVGRPEVRTVGELMVDVDWPLKEGDDVIPFS